jgi:hypothetical protein
MEAISTYTKCLLPWIVANVATIRHFQVDLIWFDSHRKGAHKPRKSSVFASRSPAKDIHFSLVQGKFSCQFHHDQLIMQRHAAAWRWELEQPASRGRVQVAGIILSSSANSIEMYFRAN